MGPEDVQTDATVAVDIGMVDLCCEGDLGWFEGVVGGKVDREEENSPCEGGVWGSHDGSLPMEHVTPDWPGRTLGRRVPSQIRQFFIDTFQSHSEDVSGSALGGRWYKCRLFGGNSASVHSRGQKETGTGDGQSAVHTNVAV